MSEIKITNVDALGKPLGQYSHMTRVKAAEYLFIAGMLAPGADFDAQCSGVFAQIGEAQVARLEATLESWNAELPALKEFILPGGTRAAAAAHLARTVCRRAERGVVALGEKEKVGEPARRYLNRLSDLLFIAGRRLNRHAGRTDVQWRHERKKR